MKDTYFVFPIHAGTVVTELVAEVDGRVLKAKVMERQRLDQLRDFKIRWQSETPSTVSPSASHLGNP